MVETSQDWFVNFDDDVHSKFWRSLLSWMSVIFMNLLIANEVICAILAYILGRYGIFFFILAYVLGRFVPI
uniref:Uncharacterized protein n=1 Tax=Acrobeloides nanus TaxID=290746 RepID=A0A914D9D5_9BILA